MKLDTAKASHYDILTAISSPGLHYLGHLKWLVTGYIRYKAGIEHRECVTREPLHLISWGEAQAVLSAVLQELKWLRYHGPNNQPLCQVLKHWTIHSLRGCNRLLEIENDDELKLLAAFLDRLHYWILVENWDERKRTVIDALVRLFMVTDQKRRDET